MSRYVFFSHPINGSGAPNQLIEILTEFASKVDPETIEVSYPWITPSEKERLDQLGILHGQLRRPHTLVLDPDDFVLMNTTAVPQWCQQQIIDILITGGLRHAYWFIHEGSALARRFSRDLFSDSGFLDDVNFLLKRGRLTILVPSLKLKEEYDGLFRTTKVQTVRYHVDVPETLREPRPASDYQTLHFLISGPAEDGNRGHLLALCIFQMFQPIIAVEGSVYYRDFDVTFVGMGDGPDEPAGSVLGQDYISRQVQLIGKYVLDDRLTMLPHVAHDEALQLARAANVVICCSMSEGCPIYVTEAMLMGSVVIHNESGGVDEQVRDGVNGFVVRGRTDLTSLFLGIEKLLARSTTDLELQAMGRASQELAERFRHQSYAATFGIT